MNRRKQEEKYKATFYSALFLIAYLLILSIYSICQN